MATSTTNTAYGIIFDAMHDAGLLGEGDQPNSEQLAMNLRRLSDLANMWQTQGLKLFLWQMVEVTLTADKYEYTFGPAGDVVMDKPLRVFDGYVLTADNVRRPITPLSWDEWNRLSQVTGNSGAINSYFVDKQSLKMTVMFWNAPDATEAANKVYLLMQTAASNPANLTSDTAFPQEWRLALRWGLADEICTGQPQSIMTRCTVRAKSYRDALENWDVEDTPTRFTPDSRMFVNSGRFK